ncbi:hypothetical protein PTTG_10184 [Puccinia triticina 1-1 BBBD Race 1]|uniref:Uncharacterized protein n=1 Tax=Puccinia triticina (isolate 1-1 / race 1 (BBBD)) TaxID=630390 RepID=A0A0C4FAE3_PUCT1|nr:hypothetical protein PTTG_10184 [Puccinia triticina 1-1 BBBD Race 1]
METPQNLAPSCRMVKIKPQNCNLKFTGTRFNASLCKYKLAANLDGALDKDKVLQIPSFLGSKDIQDAVWDMSGYATKSQATLHEQMVKHWGQVDIVHYTVVDLQALKDLWTAKGGISTLDAYCSFKYVFDVILSYLICYQHLSLEDLAVDHFFFSFSPGKLRAAVKLEMEEEVAFTSKQIKTELVPVPQSKFKAANDIMQKMEDDSCPEDAPVLDKVPAMVDNISRMLGSFEQQLEKKFVAKGTSATQGGPRKACGLLVCYYCHWKGHKTGHCMELVKDKEANLVKQKGNNFFLPNGALIPFDSS